MALAFDPSEFSTVLQPPGEISPFSFNFADAWCLPSAASGERLLSLIANRGLYPFLNFVPGLSLIIDSTSVGSSASLDHATYAYQH